MIQVTSNAREVAQAFREIARLSPPTARAVLNTVGMALRKDVRTSIRGKGPAAVPPRQAISNRIRKRPLGGRIADGIRYRRGDKSVTVGASDWAAPYLERYQRPEYREFAEYEQDRIVRAVRPGTGYVAPAMREKYVHGQYNRPARPIIEPLARSPALAARIRDTATKRLAAMARQAARKAQGAAR